VSEPESGTFDIEEYASELKGDPNYSVGTSIVLENEFVRAWEIRIEPGDRVPFHWHIHPYLFVCVEAGRVTTRFPNGYFYTADGEVGEAMFTEHSEEDPGVHDLENVGDTTVRYTTVELLR
jgi:hypothetical protein